MFEGLKSLFREMTVRQRITVAVLVAVAVLLLAGCSEEESCKLEPTGQQRQSNQAMCAVWQNSQCRVWSTRTETQLQYRRTCTSMVWQSQ